MKGICHEEGDQGCRLTGQPEDDDGLPRGVKGTLEGRKALPVGCLSGMRHDDVHPGSLELNSGQVGEQNSDRSKN